VGKYLTRRILHGLLSILAVVAIVMLLIYSLMNRDLIFASDVNYTKMSNNQKVAYKYKKWQDYGYLDYLTYAEYLQKLVDSGEITSETRDKAVRFAPQEGKDSPAAKTYIQKFKEYCEDNGFEYVRLDAMYGKGHRLLPGGQGQIFSYRDRSLFGRLFIYIGNLFSVDNIHKAEGDVGERGIKFVSHDPAYGGEKFAPAIMGNGTQHKYLMYTNNKFPFIHQNLLSLNLGKSYVINKGIDVFTTMTQTQGGYVKKPTYYPTGLVEDSADDLHSAVYVKGSLGTSLVYQSRFTDDYTSVNTIKSGRSKMGYSFVIGIIATIAAYIVGVPLGISMAQHKDKLVDKIGTVYVIFIMAVPSLAYIFLFKTIGGLLGLPTTFSMENQSFKYYVLPIVSLALPSIGSLMRWLRRYMIDQMNSDYVKFARSTGLSEREIFSQHILKNAIIPIVHGIPGSLLFAMTGAIITERVYVVPGAGDLLTRAINAYDNGVIVGVTLFYAVLSVSSVIIGDVLMAAVDPRITFTNKAR
jgi:oligopeptide transport system permease protein